MKSQQWISDDQKWPFCQHIWSKFDAKSHSAIKKAQFGSNKTDLHWFPNTSKQSFHWRSSLSTFAEKNFRWSSGSRTTMLIPLKWVMYGTMPKRYSFPSKNATFDPPTLFGRRTMGVTSCTSTSQLRIWKLEVLFHTLINTTNNKHQCQVA